MKSGLKYWRLLPVMAFWVMWMPGKALEADLPLDEGETFEFSFYGETLNAASLKTVQVKSVHDDDVIEAWLKYK